MARLLFKMLVLIYASSLCQLVRAQSKSIPVHWATVPVATDNGAITIVLPRPANQSWILSVLPSSDGSGSIKVAEIKLANVPRARGISRMSEVVAVENQRITSAKGIVTMLPNILDGTPVMLVVMRVAMPTQLWVKTMDQDSLKLTVSGPISFRDFKVLPQSIESEPAAILAALGMANAQGRGSPDIAALQARLVLYKDFPDVLNQKGAPQSMLVRMTIDPDGTPSDIKCTLCSDSAVFDTISTTMKSWRFRPNVAYNSLSVVSLTVIHTSDGHLGTSLSPGARR